MVTSLANLFRSRSLSLTAAAAGRFLCAAKASSLLRKTPCDQGFFAASSSSMHAVQARNFSVVTRSLEQASHTTRPQIRQWCFHRVRPNSAVHTAQLWTTSSATHSSSPTAQHSSLPSLFSFPLPRRHVGHFGFQPDFAGLCSASAVPAASVAPLSTTSQSSDVCSCVVASSSIITAKSNRSSNNRPRSPGDIGDDGAAVYCANDMVYTVYNLSRKKIF